MAHVGRNYKLHMRRDMCLGCIRNDLAFPEALMIQASINALIPGVVNYFTPFTLAPRLTAPDAWPMSWITDFITVNSKTFRMAATYNYFEPSTQRMNCILQVYSSTGIVAYWNQWNVTPGQCNYFLAGGQDITPTWDSAFWGSAQGFLIGCTLRAASWAEYNP